MNIKLTDIEWIFDEEESYECAHNWVATTSVICCTLLGGDWDTDNDNYKCEYCGEIKKGDYFRFWSTTNNF